MTKRLGGAPKLKPQEKAILKALLEHDYFLSTTEVAEIAGVSWNTANIYLQNFKAKRWIEHKTEGNRDYWRAYR